VSTTDNKSKNGWNFDNSYAKLPEGFYTKLDPSPVREPRVVVVNHELAAELGLDLAAEDESTLANWFSGNDIIEGSEPLAQAYAGHQFGNFNHLGDGRAHLLGEHITPDGVRVDVQLKGSGSTPYGRRGDGRAALGPMLREYIISEAMQALGVPTTRSLAVVTTGEPVYRETMLQGAVLARVASSHLRVGTFEFFASQNDVDAVRQLADYTIARHYPELSASETPYVDLLKAVMKKQIDLVVEWLRVGFIHGVMNTDNVAISGETIDYGPCAFMDRYDPETVFSSIDRRGRYAFGNQSKITGWNMARLAEALLPLFDDDVEEAVAIAEAAIAPFVELFDTEWLGMMRRKLGLFGEQEGDLYLANNVLEWMEQYELDYTNTFRELSADDLPDEPHYMADIFQTWYQQWQDRLAKNAEPRDASFALMRANNPAFIPRNYRVEAALEAAEERNDLSVMHALLDVLAKPYEDNEAYAQFKQLPEKTDNAYQTFCGT
jgi:uncharacterized protein YdiU (UPF0061 family)